MPPVYGSYHDQKPTRLKLTQVCLPAYLHNNEQEFLLWRSRMNTDKTSAPSSRKLPVPPYRIVRLFDGKRTAEQVAADLIKVHTAA